MGAEYDVPTVDELERLYESLKNWARWGDGDERGTLNHLTPERRAAAAGAVRDGISVSLARDLATEPGPDNPYPVQHHMLSAGDALEGGGVAGHDATRDYLGLHIHGLTTTHVDALSHIFHRGHMFGGRPPSEVRSDGARSNTVMAMADGVVGRGVLLDVPRALGIDFLDHGQLVTVADLEAAEAAEGVRVGPGDVLLVAVGRDARRDQRRAFDGCAGLHIDCLPWLQEREVALLGSDAISDPIPPLDIAGWPFPVHTIAIASMGLHLIDNMALVPLGTACAAAGRWEFLFAMAPLRIPRGTGCPVNPVAVL